jgi:hypothetical protein
MTGPTKPTTKALPTAAVFVGGVGVQAAMTMMAKANDDNCPPQRMSLWYDDRVTQHKITLLMPLR